MNEAEFEALFADPMLVVARREDEVAVAIMDAPEDPAAWGIVLSDVVKHMEELYARLGHDPKDVREKVIRTFLAETANPTDIAVVLEAGIGGVPLSAPRGSES